MAAGLASPRIHVRPLDPGLEGCAGLVALVRRSPTCGRLDLLVQNIVTAEDTAPSPPLRLYVNQGNGRFTSVQAGALSGDFRQVGWTSW